MAAQRSRIKVACPSCRQKLDLSDLPPFEHVSCPTCREDIIVPKPFGNLMLEEPLEDASSLALYRALDLTLDREVAVQVLLRDPDALGEAFLALARRAAGVNHPGVVPIYSCGIENGQPYFVSQFMALGTLNEHFPASPADEGTIRQAMDWCRMVAAGLNAAHGHGEVHGSVNPRSVLLDLDLNAKVAEFGLLTLLCAGRPREPALISALPYLSPEFLRHEELTPAADVFSLGVIAYRLLAGRLPVESAPTAEEMLSRWRQQGPPAAPATYCDLIPPGVSDLVARMIALTPAHRPERMSEVAEAFAAACKTRQTPSAATERQTRAVRIRAPVARRLSERRPAAAGSRAPSRWLLVLVIVAGLVVMALVAFAILRLLGPVALTTM